MKRIKGSNQYVERIQRPIKVFRGDVHVDTFKLPTLATHRPLGRFQDGAEWLFRKLTLGLFASLAVWMVISLSGTAIGTMLATPAYAEVPVKVGGVPPVLVRIANCEGVTQFDKYGNVTRGKINKSDVGRFQINEKIWGSTAKKLGFDIYTEKGNTDMAQWLLANYGSTKWFLSAKCWNK